MLGLIHPPLVDVGTLADFIFVSPVPFLCALKLFHVSDTGYVSDVIVSPLGCLDFSHAWRAVHYVLHGGEGDALHKLLPGHEDVRLYAGMYLYVCMFNKGKTWHCCETGV